MDDNFLRKTSSFLEDQSHTVCHSESRVSKYEPILLIIDRGNTYGSKRRVLVSAQRITSRIIWRRIYRGPIPK